MTSLQRKLQRAKYGSKEFNCRRVEAGKQSEQPVRHTLLAYFTLRPTKGWIRVSFKRIRAQRLMAYLLGER